ncbi:Hypothetical protein R9X50_00024800 [Acrodontium crateriforme]|uniref:Uncharacterized protein n=1 Tax=Acrodontium crateriforme TaxID=150365 RepID=A0AAQ3LZZ1_9PEZI|nr:Hypothetical protein R9X50_00024800 [Acrodontium crateriforme]
MFKMRFPFSWRPVLAAGCLVCSIVFYIVATQHPAKPAACMEQLFPNVMGRTAIKYEWKDSWDFFVQSDIYMGPPTISREQAWDALSPYGAIELDVLPTSKRSRHESGLLRANDGRILAIPGFSIQMNCLKILRRSLFDQDDTSLYARPSLRTVDQCIEKLRQDLVCAFEPTPFLEVHANNSKEQNFVTDMDAPAGFLQLDL